MIYVWNRFLDAHEKYKASDAWVREELLPRTRVEHSEALEGRRIHTAAPNTRETHSLLPPLLRAIWHHWSK